jgi:hypothetical protein
MGPCANPSHHAAEIFGGQHFAGAATDTGNKLRLGAF